MPDGRKPRPLIIALSVAGVLALTMSCAGVRPALPPGGAGGNGGAGSGNTGGGRGGGGGTGAGPGRPDGGVSIDASACTTRVACVQATGRYCGMIGDGCNSTQDCGTCPGDNTCERGVCVGGASCIPATCPAASGAVQYCGSIGDNCGHALDCGACPADRDCVSGICVVKNCMPLTCDTATGVHYCGMIGDGCGGTLNCTCAAGSTCGGGGLPNVCGSTNCPTAITCNPAGGGQYCGMIGNGCGGVQTCPACPGGMPCQANGICAGSSSTVCQNLQCQIQACTPTTKTSISGTIFDPAGKIPLYNALVYIPNAALDPVPEGVTCDRCSVTLSGSPIATALSDTLGHFTLTNVPSGASIPLVIQVGKWRRQVTIANVNPCVDNPVPVDLTHLPRTQAEGHIPRIAITTGGADALECLVRRIGISDTEFTTDGGDGRVHLYAGGDGTDRFSTGATFAPATTLWSNPAKLAAYDVTVLSCEGSTSKFSAMKPQTSVDNVAGYVNGGGRLFLSHLHFYWLQHRPTDFNITASIIGNIPAPPPTAPPDPGVIMTINQTFPKGAALAQWLNGPVVNASRTLGQITTIGSEHSVTAIIPPSTEWIYLASNPNDGTLHRRSEQYYSFNTPVGTPEAAQCGKVVFTDIHIKNSVVVNGVTTGGDDSSPGAPTAGKPFPTGCKVNETSPQGKALEFLFFDLSACVLPDTQVPQPPPPPGVPTIPPPNVNRPPAVPPPPPPPPPPNIP